MPDVPERCPECGSDLSQQFERGYHLAWYKCNSILFCNGRFQQSLACLQNQRDDLRAEAERWRKRYEALRAGVERILKEIEAAPKPEEFIPTNPDEMMAELLYAMRSGKGHNKGFADGLWVSGMMLRGLLAEAGGGDQ